MKPNPQPEGYHTVTPYLIAKGAAGAIDFYRDVFGASERMRMPGPNGAIMHAEIQIGDTCLMLADEFPQMNALSPRSIGGSPVSLMLYLPNVDEVARRAEAAGAKIERPVQDQFYGDRTCTLVDPFGHRWTIATHIEDVSPEEIQRRMTAMPNAAPPA
jgi:PhnB protein